MHPAYRSIRWLMFMILVAALVLGIIGLVQSAKNRRRLNAL